MAKKEGLPFPLAFMVLPIILHKPTRESLPPNTRTSMAALLQENSSARVLFYERVVSLMPYTREAIRFAMKLDRMAMQGALLRAKVGETEINRATRKLTDEAHDCLVRARFLGKWFAAAGPVHMVMAFWGIRP